MTPERFFLHPSASRDLRSATDRYRERSINQLINSAVAEKMSALMTAEYLDTRAKRATRRKFDAVLSKVADIALNLTALRAAARQR